MSHLLVLDLDSHIRYVGTLPGEPAVGAESEQDQRSTDNLNLGLKLAVIRCKSTPVSPALVNQCNVEFRKLIVLYFPQ